MSEMLCKHQSREAGRELDIEAWSLVLSLELGIEVWGVQCMSATQCLKLSEVTQGACAKRWEREE